MNHRVSGVNEAVVIITIQAKLRRCDIAGKDPYARLQMLIEAREIHVQLKALPQPRGGFLRIFSADEHVQRRTMLIQQVRRHMRTDVACRSRQEYRHVTPLVPVFTVSPFTGSSAATKNFRGARTSSGRPSISG